MNTNEMTPELLTLLTPEQQEAWERCQRATPGPWKAAYRGIFADAGGKVAEVEPTYMGYGDPHRTTLCIENERTANFIAHARLDLPAALLELAQTKKERAAFRSVGHDDDCGAIVAGWQQRAESAEAALVLGREVARDLGQRLIEAEKALAEARKDSERLEWLEKEATRYWVVGNGLAIFTLNKTDGSRMYSIDGLGDEDGSDFGDEIAQAPTLRAAIDAAKEGK